jgi:hypothetical protein
MCGCSCQCGCPTDDFQNNASYSTDRGSYTGQVLSNLASRAAMSLSFLRRAIAELDIVA